LQHRETVMQLATQQLDTLKRQLTWIVAHELRTPLSNIDMTTQIARRQFGSTPIMHEFVQAIEASCLRMKRVVDQTVLIGQIEAGVLDANTLSETGLLWPLEDTLLKAIHMARRIAFKQADLPIHQTGMAGDTPILCYPAALQHAFAELLANALIYSPETGGVHVTQYHDQDTIRVEIIDQGPGIPGDRQRQVLEGFRQLNRDTHEQQGMGLGLALALAIIEAHQGQLSIHSAAGQGTTIAVTLSLSHLAMTSNRKGSYPYAQTASH
jgi:signal transduction histidine kinase